MAKNNVEVILSKHFEDIDKVLSNKYTPISSRPFETIMFLLTHDLLKITLEDGQEVFDKKEELFSSKVFAQLVKACQKWYYKKYGDLAKKHEKHKLKGIVPYINTYLLAEFPKITTKIEVEGEMGWMICSTHIEEHENINDYFVPKINTNSLTDSEFEKFKKNLEKIVYLTRNISISLNLDNCSIDEEGAMTLRSIMRHIEKGIDDILTLKPESSVACWEFHLAIEKVFKVFIKQKTGKKIHGHNLNILNKEASKLGKKIDLKLLAKLPSDKEAIKHRYLEMQLSIDDLLSLYLLTLEIVNDISKDLDRKYSLYNAKILIKKPGWAW